MERFLPQKGFIVASMYAPIMFAPAPVLVFRENVLRKFSKVLVVVFHACKQKLEDPVDHISKILFSILSFTVTSFDT